MRLRVPLMLAVVACCCPEVFAQAEESPLRIFGYFQNQFQHQSDTSDDIKRNSFSLQQLNLFLQKNLGNKWVAFVNIEAINTFNSSRNWGSLRFEEAWARYRKNVKFNLKLGLQIPTFNHLNEIKNRTPLLPYVIRPLVYEASFEELISVEEYLPTRAFIQVYGFLPRRKFKLDYALFVGNSPNINDQKERGKQTGVDTTSSFLVGGRLGIRYRWFKAGFSATRENVDLFTTPNQEQEQETIFRVPSPVIGDNAARGRLGADLSLDLWKLYLEGEWISVSYEENDTGTAPDKEFYYVTLGYNITEQTVAYASYWYTREKSDIEDLTIKLPTAGLSHSLSDRITLKAQFAPVEIKEAHPDADPPSAEEQTVNYYGAAISIFF